MKKRLSFFLSAILVMAVACTEKTQPVSDIPLPEHPRPDFQREGFINLNGNWHFTFDETLAQGPVDGFDKNIVVPFPWGSPLSGVSDEGDVAWYGREICVPEAWEGKRVFLVIGASDWETTASIDGRTLGTHCGGYVPFEFELTGITCGEPHALTLKVDDSYQDWHLYGKQGYGNARGIWQTAYLEARGSNYISSLHFTPDIDNSTVRVDLKLDAAPAEGSSVRVAFRNREVKPVSVACGGSQEISFEIPLRKQHLWSLDDPYLYEVTASLREGGRTVDAVDSYFGQRHVGMVTVPGKDYKYVSLNHSPVYLQLCLDQSYNPEGFYTFPSDEFMKNEILLSKRLGLNGNRVHIKVEVPRKLYWADRLGLLIMADVPNFWGQPGPEAKAEWESCMRAQVERDYNHPSIFAWVDFNETWGLFSHTGEGRIYLPETQEWVRDMYHLTKELDPTRLVEDNSPCNNDHVETDINSWHSYNAGHAWEAMAARYDTLTVVGTGFNYIGGNTVQDVPMINSECGNVWGYEGSAGDCDYTWDYHEMMNAFHRHLHIGGWLYTEHHDVVNEWNGYVKYDRTAKTDGLDEMVAGMSICDFHSPYYIVPMNELCQTVPAGSAGKVAFCSSFTTDRDPGALTLETVLTACDGFGRGSEIKRSSTEIPFKPFELVPVHEEELAFPDKNGVYVLATVLRDSKDQVLHRNFSLYVVNDAAPAEGVIATFKPSDYTAASWSIKNLDVMDGLKVNGFGHGSFEYQVDIPDTGAEIKGASLVMELSAKQLFGKDADNDDVVGDFMLGGGTFDHCKPANSYAMTDGIPWTSEVNVTVNGVDAGTYALPDDPADHRGVLSWHAQPRTRHMSEAGSYGILVKAAIPDGTLVPGGKAVICISVPESASADKSGGLAIYGRDFGRYVTDPVIVVE